MKFYVIDDRDDSTHSVWDSHNDAETTSFELNANLLTAPYYVWYYVRSEEEMGE